MRAAVIGLLNRNFEKSDIKKTLIEKGYREEEIDAIIEEEFNKKLKNIKTVPTHKGFRGITLIITGAIILLSFLFWSRDTNFNFLRLAAGFIFLFRGICLATRPIKEI
jgi:hypothetical protein